MNFVSCNTYNPVDDPSGFTVSASVGDLVLIGLVDPGVSGFDHYHGFYSTTFAGTGITGNTSGPYSYVVWRVIDGTEDLVFPWSDLSSTGEVVVLVYSPDAGYALNVLSQTRGTGAVSVYNGGTTATVSVDCSDLPSDYYPWGTNDRLHFAWVGGFSGVSGPDPSVNSWSTSSSEASTDRCGEIVNSGSGSEFTIAAWDALAIDSGPSAFGGTVDGTIDLDVTNSFTTGGGLLWTIACRIIEVCIPDPITSGLTIDCDTGQVCWVWPGPGCTAIAVKIRVYQDGTLIELPTYNNISVEDGGPLLCDTLLYSPAPGEYCVTGAYYNHFDIEGAESDPVCCTVIAPPAEGGNHWGMLVSPVHG